jgi:hypothetical protein
VDGVMEYESPAHAPRFPYRLGIHGTVWRFRLKIFYTFKKLLTSFGIFFIETEATNDFLPFRTM